jgi:hypothetical protein
MADTRTDRLVAAAMRVQALRTELTAAEAELESLKAAGTTTESPPSAPMTALQELSLRERIRRLLSSGSELTTAEVAGTLEEPRDRVGDAMKRMEQRGELRRISPGRYAVPTRRRKG